MKRQPEQSPPRERILQAARELFYRDGINAVSVDAIAAAAGTNKMTLYRHFSSKDELAAAYLTQLAEEGDALWETARAAHPGDAQAQLRYLLKRVSEFAAESSGRGCALANAAVELTEPRHPARRVVEAHKRRQRERLVSLVREAGYAKPERVADELFLLVEGARVCLQSVGPEGPGSRLYALAEGLLDAAPKRKGQKA
ncbi:MAG TPA: TetR/AcrR family transcriptional regulator [Burkholderiales bacterium]|nr:TetR/AcrR family transcriptional regulator [Burkholderiales bacterium]